MESNNETKKTGLFVVELPPRSHGVRVVAALGELAYHGRTALVLNDQVAVALFADEAGLVGQLPGLGLEHADEERLALVVVGHPQVVELPQDVFDALVLPDDALKRPQHKF